MKEWFTHFPASSTSKPKIGLVCFPFAGGGTINYAKWRKDLDQHIDLYAINLPGRERFFKSPCLTDYEDLIKQLASHINEMQDYPIVFFGHSFGGITAYLTTLELQKLKTIQTNKVNTPIHLFISARLPPIHEFNQAHQDLGLLTQDEFQKILIEKYQGIPQAVLDSPELLNIFIPIIHNDFKMYEQYPNVLKTYNEQAVCCDLSSIGYSEDNTKELDLLRWEEFTKNSYHHLQLSGGHFEIVYQWKPVTDYINHLVLNRMALS